MPPVGQPALALRDARDDGHRPNKWPAAVDQASPQSLPREAKDALPDSESVAAESVLRKRVPERRWLRSSRFSGQGSGGKPVRQERTCPDHWLARSKPSSASEPAESLRTATERAASLRGAGGTWLPNLRSGSRPRRPSL